MTSSLDDRDWHRPGMVPGPCRQLPTTSSTMGLSRVEPHLPLSPGPCPVSSLPSCSCLLNPVRDDFFAIQSYVLESWRTLYKAYSSSKSSLADRIKRRRYWQYVVHAVLPLYLPRSVWCSWLAAHGLIYDAVVTSRARSSLRVDNKCL
jgi:hypothetical protein